MYVPPRVPRSTNIAEASRRFANVLKADGLFPRRPHRGVPVAIAGIADRPSPRRSRSATVISISLFALFGEDAPEFRLSNSGARAIVTDAWGLGEACRNPSPPSRPEQRLRRRRMAPAGTKPFSPPESLVAYFATLDSSAHDPALIIYTSGTTGNPKGALHAHRVVLWPSAECRDVPQLAAKARRPDVDAAGLGLDRRADQCPVRVLVSRHSPGPRHRARKFEPQAGDGDDGRAFPSATRSCRRPR